MIDRISAIACDFPYVKSHDINHHKVECLKKHSAIMIAVDGGIHHVFDSQVILCILVIYAKKGLRPFLAQKSKDAQENLIRPKI